MCKYNKYIWLRNNYEINTCVPTTQLRHWDVTNTYEVRFLPDCTSPWPLILSWSLPPEIITIMTSGTCIPLTWFSHSWMHSLNYTYMHILFLHVLTCMKRNYTLHVLLWHTLMHNMFLGFMHMGACHSFSLLHTIPLTISLFIDFIVLGLSTVPNSCCIYISATSILSRSPGVHIQVFL